jgi:PIN domain nuclease of toxin-antitoxin system
LLPRLLLDTHVLVRWFIEPWKLSKVQVRALESAIGRNEPLAFSAISLLEIAMLARADRLALKDSLEDFFRDLNANPAFRLLPLTYDVAIDAASLTVLREPADRIITATARVHRLRLVTSDRRIIDSGLVPVLE